MVVSLMVVVDAKRGDEDFCAVDSPNVCLRILGLMSTFAGEKVVRGGEESSTNVRNLRGRGNSGAKD